MSDTLGADHDDFAVYHKRLAWLIKCRSRTHEVLNRRGANLFRDQDAWNPSGDAALTTKRRPGVEPAMYSLHVFYSGIPAPRAVVNAQDAEQAMSQVRDLLAQHQGCERVEVHAGAVKLFAVDCEGNRLPG